MAEDRERLEAWMNAWGTGVLRLCRMSLGDARLAEDAAQETFLRAWRAMPRTALTSGEHEKAWIFRIAVNVCKDMKRSAWWRHVDTRVSVDDLPPPVQEPDAESRELLSLVAGLPDRLRKPVLLRYLSGLTLEETARALGISRPTLGKRLKEACRLRAVEWKGEDPA